MDDSLTIQQAAQRSGLSVDTLRYYERAGLLVSVERLPNGHRRYHASDLQWIDLLKCLRASAMPISEIQRYAASMRQGAATASARREQLEDHRRKVVAQLEEMQSTLERLDTKIGRLSALEAEYEQQRAHAAAPR